MPDVPSPNLAPEIGRKRPAEQIVLLANFRSRMADDENVISVDNVTVAPGAGMTVGGFGFSGFFASGLTDPNGAAGTDYTATFFITTSQGQKLQLDVRVQVRG